MQLAGRLRRPPRQLAEQIVAQLDLDTAIVTRVEIAGPGFINLRLTDAARQAVIGEVLAAGPCFGQGAASGRRVMRNNFV